MSSWQSFFNQLSRPQRTDPRSASESICHCEKGSLIRNAEMKYIHNGICSSNCFCAIIEIDKRSARKFSDNISILQTESISSDKNIETGISSLEQFLNNKNHSFGSD
ncbi:MAG: hypothetical protein ACTSQ9_03425 [Candidatus Hodarchaeales archaeon]